MPVQPLIYHYFNIPDRKREITGVGLAGPAQKAAVLAFFYEYLLGLLASDVCVKPPMYGSNQDDNERRINLSHTILTFWWPWLVR